MKHSNHSYMQHYNGSFWDWILTEIMIRLISFKVTVVSMVLFGLGVIAPTQKMFIVLMTLVAFNILTGLMAAYKEAGSLIAFWRERFDSGKVKVTIFKLTCYSIFVITSFIIEKFVFENTGTLSIAVSLMGVYEFVSIVKNIDRTLDTSFYEAFASTLSSLKNKITTKK